MQSDLREQSIDWQILKDLLRCAAELGVDTAALGREQGFCVALDSPESFHIDSVEG